MTDLSKNLLAAARDGLAPDPAVMARVRAKVTATAVPARPAGVLAAHGGKLAIGLLLVGVIAGVVVQTRPGAPASAPSFSTSAPREDELRVETAAGSSIETPPPSSAAVPSERRTGPTVASLAREVELIDQAMMQLKHGEPRAALATVATFLRETRGHGQMAEDAAAIEIEAHCRLGDAVTDRLARFDAAWPTSAQRSRLAGICAKR